MEIEENQQQKRGGPDYDRIRNAKKLRCMQMKRWVQYDRVKEKEEMSHQKKGYSLSRRGPKSVRFSQNLILLEAGNQGDTEEVRRLLSEGVCADVANSDGLSALHQCAINKNIDICRILINYSANVNAKDKELWTPLHAAAICGHRDICLLLIRSGADLLAINTDGNMPYDICEDELTLDVIESEMASKGIVQETINEARIVPERSMLNDLKTAVSKYGIASSIQIFSQFDKQGANCLHIAAACGYGDVTRYLISLGLAPESLDKDGWQAIHIAALYNQLEVIEILVSHGANIDAQTKLGETIYELVYDQEMYDRLMLLKTEVDKLKDNQVLVSSLGLIRRRSSTNPRSASIRRTSTKEKSFLSWKEARQEAELRITAESGIQENDNKNKCIDAFGNSSLRNKNRIVPETIVEVDYTDQEYSDICAVVLDIEDSVSLWPLPGLTNNVNLRSSFTHSHPYSSPTRDPETFPINPKPVLLSGTQQNMPKVTPKVHNSPRLEKPLSSQNVSPQLKLTSAKPKEQILKQPTREHPKSPGANQRQSVLPLSSQKNNTSSVKPTSSHTTPISNPRSSSQRSPREDSRKHFANRTYKAPKPDSCCLLM